MPDTKPVYASRTNWLAVALVVLSALADPETQRLLGGILPADVVTRITGLIGVVLLIVRNLGVQLPTTLRGGQK